MYMYSIYLFFFLLSDSGLNMKYSVTEIWNIIVTEMQPISKILIYNRAVVW